MQNQLAFWRKKIRIENVLSRKLFCEFAATTFLIYTGLAVDAQMYLSDFRLNSHLAHSIGWGLALVFAVQMAFRVTGSHLNPAVSFYMWSFGEFPFAHFLLYSLVQTVGAFCGAMLTFIVYFEKIAEIDAEKSVNGPNATAIVFATYPGKHLGMIGSVVDQTSCSAVLCFIIGIITDRRNRIPKTAQPAMMGLMLSLICMGFGLNAGNAMNPARDLGPRVFTFLIGYGWEVFSHNNYWFWVPVVCPFFGAIIGSWAYQFVSAQISDDEFEENGNQPEGSAMSSVNSSPKILIPPSVIR